MEKNGMFEVAIFRIGMFKLYDNEKWDTDGH